MWNTLLQTCITIWGKYLNISVNYYKLSVAKGIFNKFALYSAQFFPMMIFWYHIGRDIWFSMLIYRFWGEIYIFTLANQISYWAEPSLDDTAPSPTWLMFKKIFSSTFVLKLICFEQCHFRPPKHSRFKDLTICFPWFPSNSKLQKDAEGCSNITAFPY